MWPKLRPSPAGVNDALHIGITSGGALTSPEFSLVYLGP